MLQGWVKLWRKSVDSPVFKTDGLWKVWTWCLMRANHKKASFSVRTGRGSTVVKLFPGQFVFGRNAAAKELDMAASTVRSRMAKLKKLGNLDIQNGTHFSIITVVNWHSYQDNNHHEDNQVDRQRTSKGHKQACKELKKRPFGRAYEEFKED